MYYTYDNNGNLYRKVSGNTIGGQYTTPSLGKAVITTDSSEYISEFEFDSLDRMISSKVNNVSSQYVYNGEGLRVFKTTDGKRTEYVYDGGNIVTEMDGYYVSNSYDRNLMGVARDFNYNSYYLDPFGSITAVRDYDGNIIATAEYDAFGNVVQSEEKIR